MKVCSLESPRSHGFEYFMSTRTVPRRRPIVPPNNAEVEASKLKKEVSETAPDPNFLVTYLAGKQLEGDKLLDRLNGL